MFSDSVLAKEGRQAGSNIRLGPVPDHQDHNVIARESVHHPVLTDSEFEEPLEVSMELLTRLRIFAQNRPDLLQDPVDIFRCNLPEVATDG